MLNYKKGNDDKNNNLMLLSRMQVAKEEVQLNQQNILINFIYKL